MMQPGHRLQNYRVLRLIGAGQLGEVYEAAEAAGHGVVALKVLLPHLSHRRDLVSGFARGMRELMALDHPGIVPILFVGKHEDFHFYAMRLLSGGSLRERMRGGFSTREALTVVAELADALSHAHAKGVVHGNLKPENVLFDENGHAVLTDFGVDRMLRSDSNLTSTGMAVGTPQYLSPESVRGSEIDARSDLYVLGIILFEMLAGRAPFDGADALSVAMLHVTAPVPRLPARHQGFQALLDRLLAKNPAERFGDAATVHGELMRLVNTLDPSSEPAQHPGRTDTPKSRPSATEPTVAETSRRFRHLGVAVFVLAAVGLLARVGLDVGESLRTAPMATKPDSSTTTAADKDAPASTAAPGTKRAPTEREKRRCALHISALTADGNLVYDDAQRFAGATRAADGSGIQVPRLELPNGQSVRALVTPQGCVLVLGMAAGSASGR